MKKIIFFFQVTTLQKLVMVTQVTLNDNEIQIYNYDSDKRLLMIHSLSQNLGESFTVTWN